MIEYLYDAFATTRLEQKKQYWLIIRKYAEPRHMKNISSLPRDYKANRWVACQQFLSPSFPAELCPAAF